MNHKYIYVLAFAYLKEGRQTITAAIRANTTNQRDLRT